MPKIKRIYIGTNQVRPNPIEEYVLLSEWWSINKFSELTWTYWVSNATTYWNALTWQSPRKTWTTTKEIVWFTVQMQLTYTWTNAQITWMFNDSSGTWAFSIASADRQYESVYWLGIYPTRATKDFTWTATRNVAKFEWTKNRDGTWTCVISEKVSWSWVTKKTSTVTPNTSNPITKLWFWTHSWTSAWSIYWKWIEVKVLLK